MRNRIQFADSPWPAGHRIESFVLGATLHPEDGVRLLLHLTSADYDEAGAPADDEGQDDWSSPTVWQNYHRCTLSAIEWGWDRTSGVRAASPFDPTHLHGTYLADHLEAGQDVGALEEPAFHLYLLGHDAAADHRVRMAPDLRPGVGPGRWRVVWDGRVALAYAGDLVPRHRFRATVEGIELDGLRLLDLDSPEEVQAALERHTVDAADWTVDEEAVAARFLPWRGRGTGPAPERTGPDRAGSTSGVSGVRSWWRRRRPRGSAPGPPGS